MKRRTPSVALPRPDAVVRPPDDVADLIDQPGLGSVRERILISVHAVSPDDRSPPPA